jgi:hypothetical protein
MALSTCGTISRSISKIDGTQERKLRSISLRSSRILVVNSTDVSPLWGKVSQTGHAVSNERGRIEPLGTSPHIFVTNPIYAMRNVAAQGGENRAASFYLPRHFSRLGTSTDGIDSRPSDWSITNGHLLHRTCDPVRSRPLLVRSYTPFARSARAPAHVRLTTRHELRAIYIVCCPFTRSFRYTRQ